MNWIEKSKICFFTSKNEFQQKRYNNGKRTNGTKKCVTKWENKFKDHENCLKTKQLENMMGKSREKDEKHLKENNKKIVKI